jgi:broad specificity phosphatase PhoE
MPHLLLVRHGLNDAVGKRLAGRDMSVHLNGQGIKQAQNVAEWLANKKVSVILSSPLTRAMETAEPLAALIGVTILEQDALMEVDYGDWAGKTFEELEKITAWKEVIQSPATMRFPHGESIQQIKTRLRQFLDNLTSTYADDEVVVCFSHADILAILIAQCMGLPLENYPRVTISPASISGLTSTKYGWQIHFINLLPGEEFQFPANLLKDNPK